MVSSSVFLWLEVCLCLFSVCVNGVRQSEYHLSLLSVCVNGVRLLIIQFEALRIVGFLYG